MINIRRPIGRVESDNKDKTKPEAKTKTKKRTRRTKQIDMKSQSRIKSGLVLLPLFFVSATLGVAAEKPMNVVMLIADDLNSWLLENPQRYTGKVIAPNLKRLAESGVNFKYAYTAAPVCSPSRTAFFSGVAPWPSSAFATNSDATPATGPKRRNSTTPLATPTNGLTKLPTRTTPPPSTNSEP